MTETELWEHMLSPLPGCIYLEGATSWRGWRVKLYDLDTGEWAYELNREQTTKHGGRSWGYRLQGPFDSPQQAVAAAEAERCWLEAGGRNV